MACPNLVIFYSFGGDTQWGGDRRLIAGDMYREWLRNLLQESNIPQTISISYGHSEMDIPADYKFPLCKLFAQLASRGVSVLVASGMDGVGPRDCENTEGVQFIRFVPEFPSTCTCGVL